MSPDRARRRVAALCLPVLTAGLLAACAAEDEAPAGAPTTTAAATTAAATTAAAASTSTPAASTTAAQNCANPIGLRTDPAALAGLDATASSPAATSGAGAPEPARDDVALPRPFSTSSPWNTPTNTRAVDPRSDVWIARASRRVAAVAAADQHSVGTAQRRARDLRLYVNTCAWTPAIVGEDGGETVRVICRQRNCGPVARQVKTLRVAAGIKPFPEFDGWYSVIDQSAGVGYDMWRARRVGNVISYQFIKRWLLDGPGFSPPATQDPVAAVGARGSGLPLFAGVIQPNELRRGRIEHALAISVPGAAQRIFVAPASVTNGVNVIGSLPEGARLRLKSAYTTRKLPRGANRRSAEALITALRTYGAIVVDRSITPTLYARRSSNYGTLLLGNELQGIRLSDLEVVQSGPLLRFPPLESTEEEVQG